MNATELQQIFAVAPLRRETQQQLWYHACQTVVAPYPFLQLQVQRGGWEDTFWWYDEHMPRFIPCAKAALKAGLTATRGGVAARHFLRRYRPTRVMLDWDTRLLAAAGCIVHGMPSAPARAAAMQRALEEGADPDAFLGVMTPYQAQAADLDKPPLYFAVHAGQLELVLRLLAAGASVHKRDRVGDTPRDYARARLLQHPQCVAALALGTA